MLRFEPNQTMFIRHSALALMALSFSLASVASIGPVTENPEASNPDCSSLYSFLVDELMALSYTASFGESCVTIETLVHFGLDGTASELDAEGNTIGTFAYEVTTDEGQCVLASTASDCAVQLLSLNDDESAMIMSLDGEDATLTPTECLFGPELGEVVATSATAIDAVDASVTVELTGGVATSIELEGINGAPDHSFVYPGEVSGILAGYYQVTAVDADDCASDEVTVIVPYDLCCDCGVSDQDADGICDDEDNCFDRTASNFNDPANTPCAED